MDDKARNSLPSNIEAEKKVLGVIMLDEDKMFYALEKLSAEDFFDKANAIIFSCIRELAETKPSIDALVVSDLLESKGKLNLVGGENYIDTLAMLGISEVKFESYIDIIYQKSQLRKLIKAAKMIEDLAYNNSEAKEVMEVAEKSIFDISLNRDRADFVRINDVLRDLMIDIRDKGESKMGLTGVNSGFADLNYKLSGFQKSELIILAARPGMGKTALALNFAMNAACDIDNPATVGIFSLEMPAKQLAQRMLAAKSSVELDKIKRGALSDRDFDDIGQALKAYNRAKIFISEQQSPTLMQIRTQCRKLKAKHGLDLVIIDYLQLMSGKAESQQIMISNISKGLKALSLEMDCPIIALSQLSRKVEERKGSKRPLLSDLRDSGSIEQDADIVMFIYRDDYYDTENLENKSLAELIIAKYRSGETGKVYLNWVPEWQLFETANAVIPQEI